MGKNKNKKKNQPNKPLQVADRAQTQPCQEFPNLIETQISVIQKKRASLKMIASDSDSDISVSDFDEETFKKTLTLTMKQWFFLGLSKIIPHAEKSIDINIIKGEVSGSKENVLKFCDKAENQINTMKMKKLKLEYEISPEQIDLDMNPQWKCKVFTVELLKKIVQRIQKAYKLKDEISSEVNDSLNNDGTTKATRFLWVLNSAYDEALGIVKKIHKEHKQKNSNCILKFVSDDAEEQIKPDTARKSKLLREKKQEQSNDDIDYSMLLKKSNKNANGRKQQIKPQENYSYVNSDNSNPFFNIVNKRESTVVNSINLDLQKTQILPLRSNRRAPSTVKTLFVQDYPEQILDANHLKNWIKNNKILNNKDLKITERYDENENRMYKTVIIEGQDLQKKKKYAINMYFHHQKVIKLDSEDQQLRQKVIQKFTCDEQWSKITYKKIYTKQKFPRYEILKDLARKDNSAAQNLNSHKKLTHILFAVGLITQVGQLELQVQEFVSQIRNVCRKLQISLVYKDLDQFMRDKKLQQFIDNCIKQYFANDKINYKLIAINHIYSKVEVQVEVYGIAEKDVPKFLEEMKQKLQKLIDSYNLSEENSPHAKKILETLSQKYLLMENNKKGITLISKAKQIKQQMVSINKEITQKLKTVIKDFIIKQKSEFTLAKSFLEKKLKEGEFKDVQIKQDQGTTFKFTFIGPQMLVNPLVVKLEEFLENLSGKILDYNLSLTDEEIDIIEKDKQIQNHIEENWRFTLKYNKNYSIAAIIHLDPDESLGKNIPEKQIVFQKQFNFESLPEKSIFFFRDKKEIQSVRQNFILTFKNLVRASESQMHSITPKTAHEDKQRKCFFVFANQAEPLDIIEESKKIFKNFSQIYFYLPELKQLNLYLKDFMQKICQDKQILQKDLKITIICKKNQDLKTILNLKQGKNTKSNKPQKKWYTKDNLNKLYYSVKGNKKIQEALQNNLKDVELTNEDLNMDIKTHVFDFQNKKMVHNQSGKECPIEVHSNKITFNLNGVQKTIPDSQYQKIPKNQVYFWGSQKLSNCQLSIGFYKIDLVANKQINLFSGFSRTLGCDQIQVSNAENYNFTVNYDVKTSRLVLEYAEQNHQSIRRVINYIKTSLQKKQTEIVRPFDNQFTLGLIQKFQPEATQQNIKVFKSQDGKSAIFRAYYQKNIENFVKMLSHLGKAQIQKINVKFPREWQPQTQQIQTFIVPPNTIQFLGVQNAFTVGRIVQLVRIQNKLIYKKFYEERMCLTELNGGKKVQSKLLFHGTHKTDPKIIYEDKQESFNINYTRQNNLLGKGTYFAERSQYSYNYSYVENAMTGVRSMFYCKVLVGDSQKCLKHDGDIRDTDYKDPIQRIKYESMTDFLQGSNVYVVYKNRRAYPLYLIKFKK